MILTDMHTHLGTKQERFVRRNYEIKSYVCASTPEEAKPLLQLQQEKENENWLCSTFGLHPMYADRFSVSQMLPFIRQGVAVGEIGMDTVWCEVPLGRQEQVFEEQLELAMRLGKPVILHTKGVEKRIAQMIRHYPNRYLVHWYSDMDGLRDYQEQDCYFTLGPDVGRSEAVRQVLTNVDKERLFIETDGYESILWCCEEHGADFLKDFVPWKSETKGTYKEELIVWTLKDSLSHIAREKRMSMEEVAVLLEENRMRFLGM